jgi:hypothetical protein
MTSYDPSKDERYTFVERGGSGASKRKYGFGRIMGIASLTLSVAGFLGFGLSEKGRAILMDPFTASEEERRQETARYINEGEEPFLPIEPETAKAVVATRDYLENTLEKKAIDLFNRGISNTKFTVKEQKEVYRAFVEAVEYTELSEKGARLYELIGENLNGMDWGKPSLEKALNKEGLNVKVYGEDSEMEKGTLFLGIFLGIPALMMAAGVGGKSRS